MSERPARYRSPASPPERRPARRQRAVWRQRSRGQIAALVAIAMLAAACLLFLITVQLVLRSDYLRGRIIDEVALITGLPAHAGEVHVSWGGTTTIRDVSLLLPVSGERVLKSPAMTVTHRSIVLVIVTGAVDITSIELAQADIFATQREHGWTIVEAADRVAAHITQQAPGDVSLPNLPVVTVRDAQLIVAPEDADRFIIPLELQAEPGSMRYVIDARLGDSRARLALAMGGDWQHSLDVDAAPSAEFTALLVEAMGPAVAESGIVQGQLPAAGLHWRGRFGSRGGGGLEGELRIDRAQLGDIEVAGRLRAQRRPDGGAFDLGQLQFRRGEQRVELTGGRVLLAGSRVEVQRAQFTAGYGEDDLAGGSIEGALDLDRRLGDMTVRFFGVWPVGRIEHGGMLEAQVRLAGGFPEIQATLTGGATAGDTEIELSAALLASGRAWDDLQANVRVESLSARRDGDVWDAGSLLLEGLLLDRRLVLTAFEAAAAERSIARGELSLDGFVWDLDLEATGWSIGPRLQDATIGLSASGEADVVESWRAALETTDITALASGAYKPQNPEPIVVSIIVAAGEPEPEEQAGSQTIAAEAAEAARSAAEPPPEGLQRLFELERYASLELELQGTLRPLQLAGVSVLRTRPGAFDAPAEELTLAGRAELAGGELHVSSEEFAAFDGACTLRIAATRRDGMVVALDCDNVSLGLLGTFAAVGVDIDGRAAGSLRARWPREDRSRLVVDGSWTAHDVEFGPLAVDEARGRIQVADGEVRLRQVLASRGDGRLSGSIDSDIATWRQLWVDLTSEDFQFALGGVDLAVTGEIEGELDLMQMAGDARGRASVAAFLGSHEIGRIEGDGALDGRLLTIVRLEGEAGGGTITGAASVPLDAWTSAQATLRLDDIDLAKLAPDLEETEGRLSGAIDAAPADSPTAHAPLRVISAFHLDEVKVRGMPVGAIELEAFLGEQRAVLERADMEIAGGTIELWASTNDHDGERYIQVSGEGLDLNLQMLVNAMAPDAGQFRGEIDFAFGGGGYLATRERLFGEGRVALREADLLELPLISQLHEILSIGSDKGEGEAVVRLEGRALRIPEAGYFNSGVEVRLSLVLADLWAGADSPIGGGAVGWLRPLANSPLPFADQIDALLTSLQGGGTAVRISGTASDPDIRQTTLKELQSLLGRALGAGG